MSHFAETKTQRPDRSGLVNLPAAQTQHHPSVGYGLIGTSFRARDNKVDPKEAQMITSFLRGHALRYSFSLHLGRNFMLPWDLLVILPHVDVMLKASAQQDQECIQEDGHY
jgi:hypothetical protein